MEITFLGTSCMVPTKERNVSGIFLNYGSKGILIDCGEGTQRQMNIAGINRNKVNYVLLTHWHGDHVSGLIGLIQTLGNQQFQNEECPVLHIFGPKETEERIEYLLKTCIFENKVRLEVHELLPKPQELMTIYEHEDFYIQTARMDHGVPCLAYRFVEKDMRRIDMKRIKDVERALGMSAIPGPRIGDLQRGESITVNGTTITPDEVSTIKKGRVIAFIMDTGLCENAIQIAKNADLLISEASYSSSIGEKAEHNKHLTARDAGIIANNANAKKLIVTHISQRYKTGEEVLDDVRQVYPHAEVAYDFMKVRM